jgi:hypothetical protein
MVLGMAPTAPIVREARSAITPKISASTASKYQRVIALTNDDRSVWHTVYLEK